MTPSRIRLSRTKGFRLHEASFALNGLEVRLPASATKKQVAEWVRFELGGGDCSGDNPLLAHDLEFWERLPVLTDTGLVGRIEDSGHRVEADGARHFSRKYVREVV